MAGKQGIHALRLIAAIMCWVAAVLYAWRAIGQGPAGKYIIPAVAFAIAGVILVRMAVRSARGASKRD